MPSQRAPYPWVNQPQPLSRHNSIADENFLILRDGCCINLFLKQDGTIDWYPDFL